MTCFVSSMIYSLVSSIHIPVVSVDSLLAIAEETLAEFLSKATGTAVDWVQMIGMKVSLRIVCDQN